MKTKLYTLLLSVALSTCLFWACNPLERIDALRITDINLLPDSLSFTASGELIDNQEDATVSDHGFCISAISPIPAIDDENTDTLSLGAVIDPNAIFSATAMNLAPGKVYSVRAFMIVDGQVQYSGVRRVSTRRLNINDFIGGVESLLINNIDITINGFANKFKVEEEPVLATAFGTIVATEPDSTSSSSVFIEETDFGTGLQFFSHSYPLMSIPISSTNNTFWVWVYVDFVAIDDPTQTGRVYSQRRSIDKL